MSNKEVCIPVMAVAKTDEKEQIVPPEVGDAVNFSAEGTVSRVEGDNVYVTLSKANGEEIPVDVPMAENNGSDEDGEYLKKLSQEGGY